MLAVFVSIVIILALMGFAELLRALFFCFMKLPEDEVFLLTFLGSVESAESDIRAVMQRHSWFGAGVRTVFICNDGDILAVARKFVGENSNIDLLSIAETVYNK